MCLGDGRDLLHMAGDNIGEVFVVLEAQESHEVIFASDGVDFGHAFYFQETLRRLVNLPTLRIDQN
jgi:hypothetical protein